VSATEGGKRAWLGPAILALVGVMLGIASQPIIAHYTERAKVEVTQQAAKEQTISSSLQVKVVAEIKTLDEATRVGAVGVPKKGASPKDRVCVVYFGNVIKNTGAADFVVEGMRFYERLEPVAASDKSYTIPPSANTKASVVFDDLHEPKIAHRYENAIMPPRDEAKSIWRLLAIPLSASGVVILNGKILLGSYDNNDAKWMVCATEKGDALGHCRPKMPADKDECVTTCEDPGLDSHHGSRNSHAVILMPECRVLAYE